MRARTILVVDDDAKFRTEVRNSLSGIYNVSEATSAADFRQKFRPFTFDLVILDMRLQRHREGLVLLREALAYDELQPVIVVSSYGDTDAILDATESGALMFLHKREFTPVLLARMVEAVLQQARTRRHLAALQTRLEPADPLLIAGPTPAGRRIAELIQKAAEHGEAIALVVGDSGAGQEIAARAIHDRSRRRSSGPVVFAADVSAKPSDSRRILLGRSTDPFRPGEKSYLEQANGGTLFIHSFDSVEAPVRSALLEALRNRRLTTNDDRHDIPVDLQLVLGCSPEGATEIANSVRSEAMGERLIEIPLARLCDRIEDIPLLAAYFLRELRGSGIPVPQLMSQGALEVLAGHAWPGNLFELRSVIELTASRAAVSGSSEIRPEHFPEELRTSAGSSAIEGREDYRYQLARAEVALAERAVRRQGRVSQKELAATLGYSDRFAFARRMKKSFAAFPELRRDFNLVGSLFS